MGVSGSRSTNRLSALKVRAFAAKRDTTQPTKLSDGGGLFLVHTKAGSPVWRVKFRYGRLERLYSVGPYPAISLDEARAERDIVHAQIRDGVDPVQARQLRRAERVTASAETFEKVAGEWFDKNKRFWSDVHYEKARQAFERDVYPVIGRLPVAEITPSIVASVITKILDRGVTETASKVLQHLVGVFRLAQAHGLRDDNPATPSRELIPKKRKVTPRPAFLDIEQLRDVLRRTDQARVSEAVRLASRLVAFTAVRLGNAVAARWDHFELDGATPTWTIPRGEMKRRDGHHDHTVHLGPTIANDLRAWSRRMGGEGYVFNGNVGRDYIGREAVEKLYREGLGLAGRMSLHGWRSAFASIARDHGFSRDAVEMALDHLHDNPVQVTYDRGVRSVERIKLARWWDGLLTSSSVEA